jgi:hydroxyacylglutathione hydrolase
MILKRLYDEKLAQASYLIACQHTGLALVVDPNRDIERYVRAALDEGVTIAAVTETHIHADFVSGSRELAARAGATLYLSDEGGADWKYDSGIAHGATMLRNGSHFTVGDVRIDVVHTPGHTPEHLTFLVTDTSTGNAPMGAITGDFIFVGDVGRPDLLERAAGQTGTMDDAAKILFRSLQGFKSHPDYLQIWPGHGAGSACGKALGSMPQSTLGYEKLFNWGLVETSESRFVQEVLAGQPDPPAYFATMKRMNKMGPPMRPGAFPPESSPDELIHALAQYPTQFVIDTRSASEFAGEHPDGAINVPWNRAFLTWIGSLVPADRDLLLITHPDDAEKHQIVEDLALIGFDRVVGISDTRAFDELRRAGSLMRSVKQMNADEVAEQVSNGATVVDVRRQDEWEEGHIGGAVHIPLAALSHRLDEIPLDAPVVVHCQGGVRGAIAASIVQQTGRSGVANFTGGFAEWERSGQEVVRDTDGQPYPRASREPATIER